MQHLSDISTSTQNTWYTISDSYDYSAQDPYKILRENQAALKDISIIFTNFSSYVQGAITTTDSSSVTDTDLSKILSQIGITTQAELIDASIAKYRLLDAAS